MPLSSTGQPILRGKRIAVTGASRGLGRAFALAFSAQGAEVVINGTNKLLLEELRDDITASGGRAIAVAGSVADDSVAESIVAAAVEGFGGIDVMVNNAGIVRDRTLMNMTPEEFDDVIAVNLRGTWSASRHAARAMRSSGGGLLLQILSCAAVIGSLGSSNYAASKAGVLGMLYAWDLELERYNIRTNAILPMAQTDLTQVIFERESAAAVADGRAAESPERLGYGRPVDVAQIAVALCADNASHIRSQAFTFTGTKLAIWQHPRETVIHHREAWHLEDIHMAIADANESVCVASP